MNNDRRPVPARRRLHHPFCAPALLRIGNFRAFLGEGFDEAFTYAALRKAETIGRPIGSRAWLADMESRTRQSLIPGKRGPTPVSRGFRTCQRNCAIVRRWQYSGPFRQRSNSPFGSTPPSVGDAAPTASGLRLAVDIRS